MIPDEYVQTLTVQKLNNSIKYCVGSLIIFFCLVALHFFMLLMGYFDDQIFNSYISTNVYDIIISLIILIYILMCYLSVMHILYFTGCDKNILTSVIFLIFSVQILSISGLFVYSIILWKNNYMLSLFLIYNNVLSLLPIFFSIRHNYLLYLIYHEKFNKID